MVAPALGKARRVERGVGARLGGDHNARVDPLLVEQTVGFAMSPQEGLDVTPPLDVSAAGLSKIRLALAWIGLVDCRQENLFGRLRGLGHKQFLASLLPQ